MRNNETIREKNIKIYTILIIVVLILIAITVSIYFFNNKSNNKEINNDINNEEIENVVAKETTIENKSIDEIIAEFGGQVAEKVNEDMYYITKDGLEYTAYSDGDILSGKVTPWNGQESMPAIDEAGNINIYTAEELKWVANQVISGTKNFEGVTITLRKGIDLSGRYNQETNSWSGNQWTPIVGIIPDENIVENTDETYDDSVKVKEEKLKRFAGTFDGNNQIIKGLYIDQEKDYQGLFGYSTGTIVNTTIISSYIKGNDSVGGIVALNGGTISNSKIVNFEITGNNKIGGIVGISMPQSKIENVITEGNKNNIHGNDYIGGIIGYTNNNTTIEACKNESKVSGNSYIGGITSIAFYGTTISNSCNRNNIITGNEYIGGLVGYSEAQIQFSYNQELNYEGDSYISGKKYIGGIVGTNFNTGLIDSCYNNSLVKVNGDIAGGIAGINNATIQNTYNKGKIEVENATGKKIGGICGQNSSNCLITNTYNYGLLVNSLCKGIVGENFGNLEKCYYLDSSVKNKISDGESKTDEEMKLLFESLGEPFVKDENNINEGYPLLNWQVK